MFCGGNSMDSSFQKKLLEPNDRSQIYIVSIYKMLVGRQTEHLLIDRFIGGLLVVVVWRIKHNKNTKYYKDSQVVHKKQNER